MLNETGRNDRLLILEIDPLQVFVVILLEFWPNWCCVQINGEINVTLCYHTHLSIKMYRIDQLLFKKSEALIFIQVATCFWITTDPASAFSIYDTLSLMKVKSFWGFLLNLLRAFPRKMAATIIFALN